MVKPTTKALESGYLGKIITQLVAWLVCVVVPGVITAVAPVTWIKYQRQGDHVTARANVCLFFLIPYRTLTIDPVISVDDRTKSGSVSRYRRSGSMDKYVQAESEGFLVIKGPHQEAEVSVTPADIKSVAGKSEAFLKDPQATELKLFVVANWKFSILFGGLASLLTVLYIFGVVVTFGQLLFRKLGFGRKVQD